MNNLNAFQKLKKIHQEFIFKYWDLLNEKNQLELLHQVEALDLTLFIEQQLAVKKSKKQKEGEGELIPIDTPTLRGNAEDIAYGKELIARGEVGCIIVAGGQGTRLRFKGPKGAYPVSIINKKSLFQIFSEKTIAAGKEAHRSLPLAIMTSPQNSQDTLDFFKEKNGFGLEKDQIDFFSQGQLPLLTPEGNLFLEAKYRIAEGPDGNGSTLKNFHESGLLSKWKSRGVKYFNFVLIDNPLADPFDANLIGHHARKKDAVTVKSVLRENPEEKVGVLVKKKGRIYVEEYTELPEKEKTYRLESGALKHQAASISLFCFSLKVLEEALDFYSKMPWHLAIKAADYLDESGHSIKPTTPMAVKFEKYIFDLLPLFDKVGVLLYPREEVFAPLKNYCGTDDLQSVQTALQNRDREIFSSITGQPPPPSPFELAQDFYYPTKELLEKWSNQTAPIQSYIEP